MQGMLTEWSPPITTGKAPASRMAADAGRDVGVASHGVGVDDVGIADIDDPHRLGQVHRVVLVVVGAGMAEGEERRGLAHRAGAEARAGAELRAEVEGCAEHRDVGVDGGPSPARSGRLPKVEMPTKGRFSRPVS